MDRARGKPEILSALTPTAEEINKKLLEIESRLLDPSIANGMDWLTKPPSLSGKLAAIAAVPSFADYAPTKQTYEVFDKVSTNVDDQINVLQEVVDKDVSEFAGLVHELEIPAIVVQDMK